jgi:LuxR family transcriptional regulator
LNEIKNRLETVKEMSPAGSAIAFHVKLTSPEFLFQTYPKVWTEIYSEKGYLMVDRIVGWGFANIGSIR